MDFQDYFWIATTVQFLLNLGSFVILKHSNFHSFRIIFYLDLSFLVLIDLLSWVGFMFIFKFKFMFGVKVKVMAMTKARILIHCRILGLKID